MGDANQKACEVLADQITTIYENGQSAWVQHAQKRAPAAARDAIASLLREKSIDGWFVGDECEVRLGGNAWHRGKIVAIGRDFVGGYVRVHVPSEDMVVPRKSMGDDALRCVAAPTPMFTGAVCSRCGGGGFSGAGTGYDAVCSWCGGVGFEPPRGL